MPVDVGDSCLDPAIAPVTYLCLCLVPWVGYGVFCPCLVRVFLMKVCSLWLLLFVTLFSVCMCVFFTTCLPVWFPVAAFYSDLLDCCCG